MNQPGHPQGGIPVCCPHRHSWLLTQWVGGARGARGRETTYFAETCPPHPVHGVAPVNQVKSRNKEEVG